MQTTPLPGIGGIPGQYDTSPGSSAGSASGFGSVLDRLLGEVKGTQSSADAAVLNLAAGQVTDLHSVTLAVSKADIVFRLFLEIRNRLTDAYQEVMRMQI